MRVALVWFMSFNSSPDRIVIMALIHIILRLELLLETLPERPFSVACFNLIIKTLLSKATVQGEIAEAIGVSLVRF